MTRKNAGAMRAKRREEASEIGRKSVCQGREKESVERKEKSERGDN